MDRINRGRAPYKQWLHQGVTYLETELIDPSLAEEPFDEGTLRSYHKLFQLSTEEVESVLRPLAETEQEATGSMGDDTPMAVLSQRTRPLFDYFRQAFAQVTNPPLDPLREDCVMSLSTQLGRETNIFHAAPGRLTTSSSTRRCSASASCASWCAARPTTACMRRSTCLMRPRKA